MAEPAVAGVTFTDRLPRTHHPPRRIEVEGMASRAFILERRVASVSVDDDYFDVLGAPILAGRAFRGGDQEVVSASPERASTSRRAIVNESFVREVLGGRNPVGARVREHPDDLRDDSPGPWMEIIGVVPDLGVVAGDPSRNAALYRPAAPGSPSVVRDRAGQRGAGVVRTAFTMRR